MYKEVWSLSTILKKNKNNKTGTCKSGVTNKNL